MISLETKLFGIKLDCIFNASGPLCTSEEELYNLEKSFSGAVLTKSCTLEPREGNPEPRYFDTEWGSINSMGLPNLGYQFYSEMASKISNKPYIVSVSGMTPDDNISILEHLNCVDGVSAIELNLSCPNLIGKPQMAYDFKETDDFLYRICKDLRKPLGVKLPPYFDSVHFQKMADILNNYPISFVTCINSIGNGLVIDPHSESVVIKPKSGFGGIGGDFIKPTALANVRMFSKLLNCDISVIGCGGIKSGWDAFEHILCGASAVQIGTQLWKEGIGCFERISNELKLIMEEKGYQFVKDFRGKLKEI